MSASSFPKNHGSVRRLAWLLLTPAALFAACADDDGGQGANGGGTSKAGSAGMSSAGASSGGNGNSSAGGDGSGDAGATSQGGGAGDGTGMAGSEASGGEQSSGGSAGSNEPGAGGAGSLDDCFEGLRELTGNYQIAEKASADLSYRMRIALETADRFGTSGTFPYLPIRLGLLTPDGTVCLTDEAALEAAYTGSHHNCADELAFMDGDRDYLISSPDSTIDPTAPTTYMRPSQLTITEGGDPVVSIRLDTVECLATDFPDDACHSGGPC